MKQIFSETIYGKVVSQLVNIICWKRGIKTDSENTVSDRKGIRREKNDYVEHFGNEPIGTEASSVR